MSPFGFPEPCDQSQGLGRVATLQGVAGRTGCCRSTDHGARGGRLQVRRELIRAGGRGGLDRLDNLARKAGFLPVTTAVWRRAAELWAQARNEGYATADDSALDCDVILAAQALLVAEDGFEVIVATRNVGHLGRFVDARE